MTATPFLHCQFIGAVLVMFSFGVHAETIEQMLDGFTRCQFNGVYVDMISNKPIHKYFVERNLKPCMVKESMAYFCIRENYYGLPIYKLMIPAGTFDIHAMYLDVPLDKAQKIAKKHLGFTFSKSQLSENGDRPILMANPLDLSKSIFMCNPRSE